MTLLKLSLIDFFETDAATTATTVCRDQMLHCFLKAIRLGRDLFLLKKQTPPPCL